MFVRVLVVAYDRSPSAGLRFEVMLGYVLNVSTRCDEIEFLFERLIRF